jgi:hypothetical protein
LFQLVESLHIGITPAPDGFPEEYAIHDEWVGWFNCTRWAKSQALQRVDFIGKQNGSQSSDMKFRTFRYAVS